VTIVFGRPINILLLLLLRQRPLRNQFVRQLRHKKSVYNEPLTITLAKFSQQKFSIVKQRGINISTTNNRHFVHQATKQKSRDHVNNRNEQTNYKNFGHRNSETEYRYG